jgi:hypothetical protein
VNDDRRRRLRAFSARRRTLIFAAALPAVSRSIADAAGRRSAEWREALNRRSLTGSKAAAP